MESLLEVPTSASRLEQALERRWARAPGFVAEAGSVLASLEPLLARAPELASEGVLERLVEPERVVMFQVPWRTDDGRVLVNRGYRVQFNSALGPYKGGLRFHPQVGLDLFLSLAFEQTLKNSLTGLRLGGAKGGADFDPRGRSDAEVARFCSAFMTELQRHIGEQVDVPAGDIGVGGREIGYLFGAYKRLLGRFAPGALTGKDPGWGGSLVRREATGYGLVYFVREMLGARDESLEGKRAVVSGSGKVAIYAIERLQQLGARVLACSDRAGAVVDPDGIELATVKRIKERERGALEAYVEARPRARFLPGANVWAQPCDVALPCATQGELGARDARRLIANGVRLVAEGANLPCTPEAVRAFREAGVAYGPGKAANAGGVATSGLEMQQDASQQAWTFDEVDVRLQGIMAGIHRLASRAAERAGVPGDLAAGANMAGFERVARAMLDQGVV
ncbi:MAG TPA: NADP-specific glutamate dehydrogenase, partial [Trueperaceae bacterium]|nr:NADP-specific glutamate dehydrogenase [Trueperaceae bacterium]